MENNDFEFKYCAPTTEERKEIESIRQSYLPKEPAEKKLERLRKLDNKVKNLPVAIAIAVGVVGLLIFGLGMAMVLEWNLILWGVITGCVGLVPMGFAYPIFNKISKNLKAKHSQEILSLSEELLNDKK